MARTYIPERQSEYWTSRGVEQTLLAEGFDVITIPLSQNVEHDLPADFLFAVSDGSGPVKLFGLQYKALYQNGRDHWRVARRQHEDLLDVPWITYCLSEMRDLSQQGNAIHHCRFVTPGDVSPPRVYSTHGAYRRWAAFYGGLRQCRFGVVVDDVADVAATLAGIDGEPFAQQLIEWGVDTFIVDFASKSTVHLTPVAPVGDDQ